MITSDRSVKAALISGLKQILEDDTVVKIMHDCREPAAAILYQLQINLCNVFDTQVGTQTMFMYKASTMLPAVAHAPETATA